MILAARALLLDAHTWIEGGGVEVERGTIRRVFRTPRALARARTRRTRALDLGELVLTPGLVDAHAHLELGGLHGRVPAGAGFVGWIAALVSARSALGRRAFERGVVAGARTLLAGGTTAIGDIDATGTCTRLASALGPRLVVYRELLDAWDPLRTPAALRVLAERGPRGARAQAGLSPHAPYTVSPELLASVRAASAQRLLPLMIHWAETPDERAWLEHGRGPLAALLPRSPRCSGLDLLEAAGLLTRRTALVHGNHPRAAEIERLARRGVTLVHCPGAHAFFARARFPLERYRAAGVPIALGTDSLAGNDALDMRREMALLRAAHPRLDPAAVFEMASAHGARALTLRAGRLRPGAAADAVAWRLAARTRRDALEELTAGLPVPGRVWVAGRALGAT